MPCRSCEELIQEFSGSVPRWEDRYLPVGTDHSYLEPWAGHTPIVFVDRRSTRLAADSVTEDDKGGSVALPSGAGYALRLGRTGRERQLVERGVDCVLGLEDRAEAAHVDLLDVSPQATAMVT